MRSFRLKTIRCKAKMKKCKIILHKELAKKQKGTAFTNYYKWIIIFWGIKYLRFWATPILNNLINNKDLCKLKKDAIKERSIQ